MVPGTGHRLARVGVSAVIAAVALAASALGATGEVTPKGCIEDAGQDECATETAGLNSARSVAVSPDGTSVYAASGADDAIVRFKRDPQNGALTPKGCIEDTGQDECATETAGLSGAFSVAVSPDGKSVYVASTADDAIVRFKRDPQNGALTPKGCIEDTGEDGCDAETPGLANATSVTVTADGTSVYATGLGDDAIVRFKRDTQGALTPKGCVEDTDQDECSQETPGLQFPTSVAVSPDGTSVYAAGSGDDAVVRFKRDTQGALTPKGCVEDTAQDECEAETPGLHDPNSVAVSPDGTSVYAAGGVDDAIVRFKRSTQGGGLTPEGCVEDTGQDECATEAPGLDGASSVAVSPDGTSLYATSVNDDALVRFKRSTTSGGLTPKDCVEDTDQDECNQETPGLDVALSAAVSPDGKSVYAVGNDDDAVVRFKREQ